MLINKKEFPLPINDLNDLYVVADFDRTITEDTSKTSWSILSTSDLMPLVYTEERNELYQKYRPIEIDPSLEFQTKQQLMKEWFEKHINLFIKYQVSEEIFKKAATDLRIMSFRPKAKEFLEFLHQNNIPLIIISAGIGNFIEYFLKNNDCYFENIYISSNKIIFNNGIATGVDQNIIHSLNKNEVVLPDNIKTKIKNRKTVVLLGDQPSDLKMVEPTNDKRSLSIALYSEESYNEVIKCFDVICEKDDDYNNIQNLLFK